jgi:hypothetical protein
MPTALIQRWNVQKYCEDFPVYPDGKTGSMIHCNDGTWDMLIGIDDSFSEAFLQGGPMGFSCDLASFPVLYKERWRNVIEAYKQDRGFYQRATARILVDTASIIVIEYADEDLAQCVIQIFTKTAYAQELLIYPAVCPEVQYRVGDAVRSGTSILEDGILVNTLKQNAGATVKLTKI